MAEQFVASGIGRLVDPQTHAELLRSTVRLTRLAFGAAAASIFLYDADRDRLVFEASSGHGEDRLPGTAIPADAGLAGWVFQSGEIMVVNDVSEDARFDLGFAQHTGYVPTTVAAAPLVLDDPIGVLEVLDAADGRLDLAGMDLLVQLADHLAASVSLLLAARTMKRAVGERPEFKPWLRLEETLTRTQSRESPTVHRFVNALDDLIATCYADAYAAAGGGDQPVDPTRDGRN